MRARASLFPLTLGTTDHHLLCTLVLARITRLGYRRSGKLGVDRAREVTPGQSGFVYMHRINIFPARGENGAKLCSQKCGTQTLLCTDIGYVILRSWHSISVTGNYFCMYVIMLKFYKFNSLICVREAMFYLAERNLQMVSKFSGLRVSHVAMPDSCIGTKGDLI